MASWVIGVPPASKDDGFNVASQARFADKFSGFPMAFHAKGFTRK